MSGLLAKAGLVNGVNGVAQMSWSGNAAALMGDISGIMNATPRISEGFRLDRTASRCDSVAARVRTLSIITFATSLHPYAKIS
jgi:hypothetical protein